jgi:general secretion pathway protein D
LTVAAQPPRRRAQGQSDTSFKTTLIAEPRSNALILRAANPARVAQVRALVDKLDQPPVPGSSAASGNIHVVYLKNADATKLATTLRAAMSAAARRRQRRCGSGHFRLWRAGDLCGVVQHGIGQQLQQQRRAGRRRMPGHGRGGGSSSANSNQPSTGGQIQADPTTNSLIITAPEPLYRQLRAVIDKLDGAARRCWSKA